jgi:hypothetical protein
MITTNTTHVVTIRDRREEKLNSTPSRDGAYRFPTIDGAEELAQFLLERDIKSTEAWKNVIAGVEGSWRKVVAGGTREVTISPVLEEAA